MEGWEKKPQIKNIIEKGIAAQRIRATLDDISVCSGV